VRAHQAEYPVKTMCRVLEVSRSGYYAWLGRDASPRAVANAGLRKKIEAIHKESDGTYGAPRVHAELKSEGNGASRNRVARVMREAGIEGVSRRKRKRTTVRVEEARPAPDLVERDFTATGPDQLWVADITYVPTWTGFLYLAIVLDAWSRRVVGWAMETHLRTELVLKALEMAVWQRKPAGVIHHSDQGSQYTSVAFGRRCEEMGVRPSMGSVGDAYDNAMAESFFASLECELIARHSLRTQAEGRMAIFRYIEGWYNPRRRHSALNYESPVSFESKYGLADVKLREDGISPTIALDVHAPGKARREDAPGSTIAASSDLRVPPVPGPDATVASSTASSVPGPALLHSSAPQAQRKLLTPSRREQTKNSTTHLSTESG
jgi:putative transposase